ncbi:MAG: PilX N-terminal domain-containing pilus assembly protein [Gammaproteobacteria bacterium]
MPVPATVTYSRTQTGAALVVSMVMLLVITVIGVAVMSGSHLEWLMANNTHLQTDAYRNAEIALAQGLSNIVNPPTSLPTVSTLTPQELVDVTKWSDGTITSTPVLTTTGTSAYVTQYLGCGEYGTPSPLTFKNNDCTDLPSTSYVYEYVYRVWALGTDGKGATRLLQATRTLINNQLPVAGLPGPGGHPPPGPGQLPYFDSRVELPSS